MTLGTIAVLQSQGIIGFGHGRIVIGPVVGVVMDVHGDGGVAKLHSQCIVLGINVGISIVLSSGLIVLVVGHHNVIQLELAVFLHEIGADLQIHPQAGSGAVLLQVRLLTDGVPDALCTLAVLCNPDNGSGQGAHIHTACTQELFILGDALLLAIGLQLRLAFCLELVHIPALHFALAVVVAIVGAVGCLGGMDRLGYPQLVQLLLAEISRLIVGAQAHKVTDFFDIGDHLNHIRVRKPRQRIVLGNVMFKPGRGFFCCPINHVTKPPSQTP